VTLVALVLLGIALCVGLGRGLGGGRRLTTLLLGVLAVRLLLAVGLYAVSALELPLLASLHRPGGFWAFAVDAAGYHETGAGIAAAMASGGPMPLVTLPDGVRIQPAAFYYYVALVYRLLGPHPLHVPLLNAVLGAGTAALAYALARRLSGARAAEAAALAVGLWPSAVLWSSQVLKDALVTLLVLATLALVIRAWDARVAALLPLAGLLAATIAVLADTRPHAAAALPGALALALAGSTPTWVRPVRVDRLARVAGLVLAVGGLVVAALMLVEAPGSQIVRGAPRAAEPASGLAEVIAPVLDPVPSLDRVRQALLLWSGRSDFATDVRFHGLWDVLAFVPRAVAHALYYPLPWEWTRPGPTGAFKLLAGLEAVALLALTPLLALAARDTVRDARFDAWLLLAYGALLLVGLAVVVPNAGTLVRLRLQPLTPLLVLIAGPAIRIAHRDRA
jgi:4-amino-4-deoxy-L-arabinose transferase-like glycosyltransferase